MFQRYSKEQAVAKLEKIAENFTIRQVPNKKSFHFLKDHSPELLQGNLLAYKGVAYVLFKLKDSRFIHENDTDSSEDELVIIRQPKRTLPSVSHLLMRKELRKKAKSMACEKQYKDAQANVLHEKEQKTNSGESEELETQCEAASCGTIVDDALYLSFLGILRYCSWQP